MAQRGFIARSFLLCNVSADRACTCGLLQVLRQQVAKGEALCAIFTGNAGTAGTLLLPTIDTLLALLQGPRSGRYRHALPRAPAHPALQARPHAPFSVATSFFGTWLLASSVHAEPYESL